MLVWFDFFFVSCSKQADFVLCFLVGMLQNSDTCFMGFQLMSCIVVGAGF